MNLDQAVESIARAETLDRVGKRASDAVKRVVGRGWLKDLLSGVWLGHPLHPLLTDIPIGSFTSASVLDLLGGRRAHDAADGLVALGLISAAPTALAGAADWSETYGKDQRIGVAHAVSNIAGLGLYAWSLGARRRGSRARGVALGLAGMGVMTVGGYLGGTLVYRRGVGVDNAFFEHPPDEWTAVLAEAELADGQSKGVVVDGATVLLRRSGDRLLAIGGRCSHAGGPLPEGAVDPQGCTVECPWHGSVFDLDDGSVVHGPATAPQTAYDVRVRDSKIEVRHRV